MGSVYEVVEMNNENQTKEGLISQTQEKKKFPIWIVALFLIIALAVGSYFFVSRKPVEVTKSREKVRLGISKSFLSIPAFIAKRQGYFAKEGLDVTVKEYSSGKKATQSLFAGEVDISTVADMPVVFNSFKREDFCVFATFTYSYPFVKIIARKDKDIKTGADLKGKKVGADKGTSSHFFLAVFLIHNQLSISEVKMNNIRTVDLPAALKNKEVDVISVWQPYAQKAKKLLQDNAIELPTSEIYRTTFNLAVMKSFAKDHPEILKKFLRALDKSAVFIKDKREKSQNIITESFKLDKGLVRSAWNDFVFGIFLDQSLLVAWDEIARWAIENKFTDRKELPNYLNFIYLDALEAVKPESITIIR